MTTSSNKPFDSLGRKLATVREVFWQQLATLPEPDLKGIDFTKRLEIHEFNHVALWQQYESALKEHIAVAVILTLGVFPEIEKLRVLPIIKKEVILPLEELLKNFSLVSATDESIAMTHQVLGQLHITDNNHYSHHIWLDLMSRIVEQYSVQLYMQDADLFADSILQRKITKDLFEKHSPHNFGTILILLSDVIDPDVLAESLDLVAATPYESMDELSEVLLDKIALLSSNPDMSAQFLLDNYPRFIHLFEKLIQVYSKRLATIKERFERLVLAKLPPLLREKLTNSPIWATLQQKVERYLLGTLDLE